MTSFKKTLLSFLLVAGISSGISIALFSAMQEKNDNISSLTDTTTPNSTYATPTAFTPVVSRPAVENDFTQAAANTVNAVVSIKSTTVQQRSSSSMEEEFFRYFFGQGRRDYAPQPRIGMGSGVIISEDGYIVTNNHVIDQADKIENTSGELVGINTAIYSETGNYAGYSFAIPTSIVSKVITDLKQYGTVQRAMLGVSIMEMNDHLAKEKKIDLRKGVYVAEVSERSAAMEADLKPGDVIVAINGVATPTVAILQEQIARYRPGDKVKIEFFRGKDKKQSDAVLKNSYGNTDVTKATNIDMLGATLKEAGDSVKAKLRIRGGVEVVKVKEGQFKKAGIHDGFVILDINGTKIMNVKDVESVFQSLMRGDARDKVMFIKGLYQNGRASYYAVPLVD